MAIINFQHFFRLHVITFHKPESFFVPHQRNTGIFLNNSFQRTRVVGLHVVNHQVIDGPVADNILNIVEVLVDKRTLNRVDERNFVIDNQVGIIGNSMRNGPDVFEQVGAAIVESQKPDVFSKIYLLHNV